MRRAHQKVKVRKYRDSNRPTLKFVVSGREEGKRTRRFFSTKSEAETYARSKNIELLNSGTEGAEFPTALRVMAQECNSQLAQYGRTIADATDFFVSHLKASEKSCNATDLVTELRTAKQRDGASERYLSDLKHRLHRFAKHFEGQVVAAITSAQIDDWLRALPVGPVTRNNFRRVVIVAFNFAMQRGYATSNPAANTAQAKPRDKAPGILTVGETARLLENASPELLPYVAIGAFAGLRRAELERLDWSEVDFDSELIEVTAVKSKTAQRRFVTIQPNLREWMTPMRKHKGSVLPEDFRTLFDAARTAAGIVEWPDNALRHGFASYHLAHFKNAASTALELGHHDSRITFRHYRELVRPKESDRYWNIRPSTENKVVAMP